MAIKKDNKVEKLNILNEMRGTSMNLQEVRFLSIYLSKINARDTNTRKVRFLLDDFKKIMDLGRLNIDNIKEATKNLLQKIVTIRTPNGGYKQFQLFKEALVEKDENDEWYVEIDAHDMALPLFFEFKNHYFTYELWNALRLNGPNQQRMYELLKQHQKQGEYTFTVNELKELLFISKDEYKRFGDFKVWVLNKTQTELKLKTDISFDYELIKKGAKVVSIRFIIKKNNDYIDQLTLAEFIDFKKDDYEYIEENDIKTKQLNCLFNNEFTNSQINEIILLATPMVNENSSNKNFDELMNDYLALKYASLNARKNIKHRYNYFKKLILIDIEDLKENKINNSKSSLDIKKLEELID